MNLYITPDEIKADIPDLIQDATTRYNGPLYRRCVGVSRKIDQRCKREFFPTLDTKYFSVGRPRGAESALGILWIPSLISVTSISLSYNNGSTYEDLAETDYIPAVSEDFDKVCSYNMIILDVNGNYSSFPVGQRSVKITGVWGYTDDRDACWEDSGLTISADMDDSEVTFSLADADAHDQYGLGVALQLGRLIKIGSEFMQVISVDTEANEVTVIRSANGTTSAAHASGSGISLWRPPFSIIEAARITVMRDFMRGQQGYADARGGMDLGGEMRWTGRWDPEAIELLRPYILTAVG